jgi:excisionase family DNA binding protein
MMSDNSKTQTNGPATTPEFMIAEEVSARLRLPLSTVYHLAKSGVLPALQLGRTWRFRTQDIDELGSMPAPAQVLVVDDDEVTRALVAGLLQPRGHWLVEAGDAEAGLAAARRQRFDLLLIDFKLPGRNGTELVHELRDEYSPSQIVMITAFPDLVQINQLFELGALTLLRKPLESVQFLECVERILDTRSQKRKQGKREKAAHQNRGQEAGNAHSKNFLSHLNRTPMLKDPLTHNYY